MTIHGSNFGVLGPVLKLHDRVLEVVDYDHTWIAFNVPAGQGRDLPIVVNVSAQVSDESAWLFSYLVPSVQSIAPLQLRADTRGGANITVGGENFGKWMFGWYVEAITQSTRYIQA